MTEDGTYADIRRDDINRTSQQYPRTTAEPRLRLRVRDKVRRGTTRVFVADRHGVSSRHPRPRVRLAVERRITQDLGLSAYTFP
jgi:hypothetical protein